MSRRRRSWVIVVFGLGLGACGGKGSSPSSSDGGGGNASTAGDGPRGAGGAASADAGGGDAGGLMTATEVCRAAIRVLCERHVACIGEEMSTCMRFAALCPDYYFNADSNRTVDGVAACLPAMAAQTCTDFVLNLYPACFISGRRPDGAGCAYSSQCHSGACGGGDACSICRSGALGVIGATVVHAAQGQPCDLGGAVGCAGNLICAAAQTGSTAGTCVPPPGAGQPCASAGFSNMICAAGTSCTAPSGGTCITAGACGGGVVCGADSYCKPGDGGFTCAPRAGVGQPCASPGTATVPDCLAPAVCYYTVAKCVVLREAGEACDDNNPCTLLLNCVNGTCHALGSTSCPADGGV